MSGALPWRPPIPFTQSISNASSYCTSRSGTRRIARAVSTLIGRESSSINQRAGPLDLRVGAGMVEDPNAHCAMETTMALYVITRVCVDADGWLEEVTWREAEGTHDRLVGAECRVRAADVLRAMDENDSIELIATGPGGSVSAIGMLVCEETPEGRKLRLQKQDEDAQHRIELYTL